MGVGNRLTFGRLAHQNLTFFGVCDDGRSGAIAFAVLDNFGLVAFHYRNARVGRTQVNANDFTHVLLSAFLAHHLWMVGSNVSDLSLGLYPIA